MSTWFDPHRTFTFILNIFFGNITVEIPSRDTYHTLSCSLLQRQVYFEIIKHPSGQTTHVAVLSTPSRVKATVWHRSPCLVITLAPCILLDLHLNILDQCATHHSRPSYEKQSISSRRTYTLDVTHYFLGHSPCTTCFTWRRSASFYNLFWYTYVHIRTTKKIFWHGLAINSISAPWNGSFL